MSFRCLYLLSLILPGGFLVGCQADESNAESATVSKPPNILLIVADDLGYTDLGAFGSEIPTPARSEKAWNDTPAASITRLASAICMSTCRRSCRAGLPRSRSA